MLDALERPELRDLAWKQLPRIVDHTEPIGPLAMSLALEAGIASERRPLLFPTSDDQQAGLVGGGAVDAGQMAVILGTSAVVNASSDRARESILPAVEAVILNHLHGPDPAEGIRAFQEGRPADWRTQRAGAGPEPASD